MRKYLILATLLSLAATLACADTRDESRVWLGLFAKKNLAPSYDLWAEAQLRYDQSHQTMNQTLNRFGVLRNLENGHELGLLFAYVQTGLVKEYRPTLQHAFKRGQFSNRNRLEGRDIEDNDTNSLRLRTLLRWEHPLSSRYHLVLWDEPFFNLTHETWTGNRFVERNRAFIGTKVSFDKLNMEVGYMNQYVPRDNRDLSEHILTIYIFF